MNSEILFDRIKSNALDSKPVLSIGTLTADVMDQQSAVRILEEQGIGLLHIDVMDGRIWPKITVGPFFVAGLKTKLLKDVHLLIEEPAKQIPSFVASGADMISFSIESCDDVEETIALLRSSAQTSERTEQVYCGLSVYPDTPIERVQPFLEKIDYVTLVSIGPETGKTNFLHEMPARISELRSWRNELLICIDGAVKKSNINDVASMGGDVIVTGSAVFDGNDAAQNIVDLKQAIANLS